MSDAEGGDRPELPEYLGIYEGGAVRLAAKLDWPDGTPVAIRAADPDEAGPGQEFGRAIIAGFGLPGRWVADIFDRYDIEYVVVEQNPASVAAQRKLGRTVIEGDIASEEILRQAGIQDVSVLVLTVPEETAVLEATRLARAIKPGLWIVARTLYASTGLQASQVGADEVIAGEQAVARQFYELLLRRVNGQRTITVPV